MHWATTENHHRLSKIITTTSVVTIYGKLFSTLIILLVQSIQEAKTKSVKSKTFSAPGSTLTSRNFDAKQHRIIKLKRFVDRLGQRFQSSNIFLLKFTIGRLNLINQKITQHRSQIFREKKKCSTNLDLDVNHH